MNIKKISILGFLTAILFVSQIALSFLPNIELISLQIILYTLLLRKKVFFVIYSFALLEGLYYGFGLWWVMYLYVWSILAIAVLLLRNNKSPVFWAIISGMFGLCFGALCAIPYFFVGGVTMMISYWISGIMFDVTHCIGNIAVTLILFKPIYTVLSKQLRSFNLN